MVNLFIDKILEDNSITAYLTEKGFTPVKENGNRLLYNCPIPGHDDSNASFTVYQEGQIEKFYCFGCQNRSNIINLYCLMEDVSLQQAIKALGKGIIIDPDVDLEHAIKEWGKCQEKEARYSIDVYDLFISRSCYTYLNKVNFDEEEMKFVDKILEKVDMAIHKLEAKTLEQIHIICDEGLSERYTMFLDKQDKRFIEDQKNKQYGK